MGVEMDDAHRARVPDAEKMFRELGQRGILVRRVENDPLIGNCLRINVGTAEENNLLLKAMEQIIKS